MPITPRSNDGRPKKHLNPSQHHLVDAVVADRPFANLTWEDVAEHLPFEADGEPRSTEPAEAARELRETAREMQAAQKRLEDLIAAVSGNADRDRRLGHVRASLGKEALIPYADFLAAAGISREVGDRLRERDELSVVVVDGGSKNPKLYVTAGAAQAFARSRKVAPPPSKSKLSKAKRAAKRQRTG